MGRRDLSHFAARFPQLDLYVPVILPVDETSDDAALIELLKDFVSLFSVREIATTTLFRQRTPALSTLHKQSDDHLLLLQSIEEEELRPSSYELPRVSLWTAPSATTLPTHLYNIKRPFHVIIAPDSTLDPWATGRRIGDTGSNVLRADQFYLGARQ